MDAKNNTGHQRERWCQAAPRTTDGARTHGRTDARRDDSLTARAANGVRACVHATRACGFSATRRLVCNRTARSQQLTLLGGRWAATVPCRRAGRSQRGQQQQQQLRRRSCCCSGMRRCARPQQQPAGTATPRLRSRRFGRNLSTPHLRHRRHRHRRRRRRRRRRVVFVARRNCCRCPRR